jgi:hypothetical protein
MPRSYAESVSTLGRSGYPYGRSGYLYETIERSGYSSSIEEESMNNKKYYIEKDILTATEGIICHQ